MLFPYELKCLRVARKAKKEGWVLCIFDSTCINKYSHKQIFNYTKKVALASWICLPEEFFSMQILVLTLRNLGESVFEGKLNLTSKPIQEMTSMKIKKSIYFDEKLYKKRTVIMRANGWINGFKALIVRYEKTISSCIGLHWIAFTTIFINQIDKKIIIN